MDMATPALLAAIFTLMAVMFKAQHDTLKEVGNLKAEVADMKGYLVRALGYQPVDCNDEREEPSTM